jgi:hypothetical protein
MVIEPWTPDLVSGAYWLESYQNNDFSFSGGSTISSWINKYNPSQTFVPFGTGAPTYDDSQKLVTFNGSHTLRTNRGSLGTDANHGQGLATNAATSDYYFYTLFIFKSSTSNTGVGHVSVGGFNFGNMSGVSWHLVGNHTNNQLQIYTQSDRSRLFGFNNLYIPNTWGIYEVFYDLRPYNGSVGTNTIKAATNCGDFQTVTTSTSGVASNTLQGSIGFGNNLGTSYIPLDVKALYIAQLDVNSADSFKTIEKIRGYFAHRFNLTSLMPGGHQYKNVKPVISSYSSITNLEQNIFTFINRIPIQNANNITVADTDKVTAVTTEGFLYNTTPGNPVVLTASGAARPTYNATNKYIEFGNNQIIRSTVVKNDVTVQDPVITFGFIAVVEFISYGGGDFAFFIRTDLNTSLSFNTWRFQIINNTTVQVNAYGSYAQYTFPANTLSTKCIISWFSKDWNNFRPDTAGAFRINGLNQSNPSNVSGGSGQVTNSITYTYNIGAPTHSNQFRLYDFLWVNSSDQREIEKYEYQLAVENNIRSNLDASHPYKVIAPKY